MFTRKNRSRISCCAAILAASMMLGGCSFVENFGTKLNGIFSKSDNKKSENPYANAVMPTDREQIMIDVASRAYSPADLAKGIAAGDWAIESVRGQKAIGETTPYIKFVPSQKRIYGNNGCNTINAGYKYNPADSTMSFQQVATTLRYCAMEGITDSAITSALNEVQRYTWNAEDDRFYFHLLDAEGNELLTLMHQNFDFLNGTWRITSINEEPVETTGIMIVIDVDEGKIHCTTGCNVLNGTLETDMKSPNSISFQAFAKTKVACPDDANYELPLLVALEDADSARPIGPDKTLLLNTQGKVVLTLDRVKD